MSEELDTTEKIDACSIALCEWFKSQDLEVCDAVMLMQWTQARLILENSEGPLDTARKIELAQHTLIKFLLMIKAIGRNR